jgi:predicted nucleotidyltransferase component of viral defense system
MLHWNTVNNLLREVLLKLMGAEELREFRLVGGTALSLQLGHRVSVDIDFFTDAAYGSIDFDEIENYLKNNFDYVDGDFGGNPALGKSYAVGTDRDNAIKLDIFYAMDPFFQGIIEEEGVRMATTEEIVAMKIDVVQRGGRKKDFWDLHELLEHYTINEMIAFHRVRSEWTHKEALILDNFIQFAACDDDLEPNCLRGKQWEFIKEDIEEALANR